MTLSAAGDAGGRETPMEFETLASGYGLIEGPRVDAQDNLYFSDVTQGGVYRRSPGGAVDPAHAPPAGS
jgi:sugar lactone lactonase YvrE